MLVDDHAVVRMGFRLLLQGTADIEVVAEADSGEEAVRQFPEVHPDVVVMDISMPGIGGLEAIGRILAREPGRTHPGVCRRMRTRCTRGGCSRRARSGYLTKRSAAEELIQAIRQVAQGKTFLEPLHRSAARDAAARAVRRARWIC